MKPEERAEIMKTLKELTGKISQLKDELKTSSTASTPSKLKSKTEVFIVQHTCLLDFFFFLLFLLICLKNVATLD